MESRSDVPHDLEAAELAPGDLDFQLVEELADLLLRDLHVLRQGAGLGAGDALAPDPLLKLQEYAHIILASVAVPFSHHHTSVRDRTHLP